MFVTIKEIAEKLNMSPTTVSFALRGKNPGKFKLAPATVKEICEVAKEMDYRPNILASSLKNNKTRTIGVMMRFFEGDIFSDIFAGFNSVMSPCYDSLVTVNNEDVAAERRALHAFVSRRVDAIFAVFSGAPENIELYKEITEDFRIPLVLMDISVPGLSIPVVRSDHYKATYEATKSLQVLGHRKIKFVTISTKEEMTHLRRNGYLGAMREAGLEMHSDDVCQIRIEGWEKGMFQNFASEVVGNWIAEGRKATAFLITDDFLAYEFLEECEERRGIKIPDDLSIMGVGDRYPSRLPRIGLSSVSTDYKEHGIKAADMLLDLMAGRAVESETVVPVEVRLRKTTRVLTHRI